MTQQTYEDVEFLTCHNPTLPDLPLSREDRQAIAEKIEKNEIDEEVYYAMLRGEKPDDIFTPEMMTM